MWLSPHREQLGVPRLFRAGSDDFDGGNGFAEFLGAGFRDSRGADAHATQSWQGSELLQPSIRQFCGRQVQNLQVAEPQKLVNARVVDVREIHMQLLQLRQSTKVTQAVVVYAANSFNLE